jgi:signal transduction histidine kinase
MDMAEVDFAAVVKAAEEMTALGANGREIHLSSRFDLDPAPLLGDRVRLLQVVWNLLSNAIKFTPIGGTIDVRLDRVGNDARLSVSDNGSGISAQFLPHVFELYQQGQQTGGHMPGLGIGLAIVAQVVKLHGGTARVESVGLDHGSTFIVTLPLRVSGRRSGKPRRSEEKS